MSVQVVSVRGVAVDAIEVGKLESQVELFAALVLELFFVEVVEGPGLDEDELVRDGPAGARR